MNEKHELQVTYDEEDYEMLMILLYEDKISYYDLKGKRAVLIPFFYCGNADSEAIIHYIVLYNKESYLLKIHYYQEEEEIEYIYVLNDNLKEVTKDILTPKLRKHFIKQVKEKYAQYEDF